MSDNSASSVSSVSVPSNCSWASKTATVHGFAPSDGIADPSFNPEGWTVVSKKKGKKKAPPKHAPKLSASENEEPLFTLDEWPALPPPEHWDNHDNSSDSSSVFVEKVVPAAKKFERIVKQKTAEMGFKNKNIISLVKPVAPAPTTLSQGAAIATTHTSYVEKWKKKVDNFTSQTFDLEHVLLKGAHGLPLRADNCPDMNRVMSLKASPKALENLCAVLRKAAKIICAVSTDIKEDVMSLATPGGLFRLLVKNDGYNLAIKHYASTNSPSSVVQYSSQLKNFVTSYFNCYLEDCVEVFPEMTQMQLTSQVNRIEQHLQNVTATGKRDLKHDKHIRQEVKVKEASGKIPMVENYRKILHIANGFLKKSYENCLRHLKSHAPLWNLQTRKVCDEVSNAMWAVRVHFMFNSDAQRANQYELLLQKEFYIFLMRKRKNAEGRTILEEVDKECLGSKERSADTISRIDAFRRKSKLEPDKISCHICRIPHKIDKKVRGKDVLWCRWNIIDPSCVWFIVHYCLQLLPLVAQVANENGFFLDQDHMFFNTKSLKPMNGTLIVRDMAGFYNFHAKKNNFPSVVSTAGATVWRHAFATSELQKFDAKTDYGWCRDEKEAASFIAFKMNTSAEEILTTYSTRINLPGEASMSDRIPHQSEFVIDVEDSDSYSRNMKQCPAIVSPPPRRTTKRKQDELMIESEDDEEQEGESQDKCNQHNCRSEDEDHLDEDGFDTRKQAAI